MSIPPIFLFYWCGRKQNLDSFPTRRSSDLLSFATFANTFASFAVKRDSLNRKGCKEGAKVAKEILLFISRVSRQPSRRVDRNSTRLNSTHTVISYAVFCLKTYVTTPRSLAC